MRSPWDAVVSSLLRQHILKTGHQYLPAGHTLKTSLQTTDTHTQNLLLCQINAAHTHTHSLYCNFCSPPSPLIGFLSVVIFFLLSSISLIPLRNIFFLEMIIRLQEGEKTHIECETRSPLYLSLSHGWCEHARKINVLLSVSWFTQSESFTLILSLILWI